MPNMPHPTDTTWMPMPLNAVQNAKETYISDVAYNPFISTCLLIIPSFIREKRESSSNAYAFQRIALGPAHMKFLGAPETTNFSACEAFFRYAN